MALYTITVKGLKPKQALSLLESIPDNALVHVRNDTRGESFTKHQNDDKPRRVTGDAIVCLTTKKARPDSRLADVQKTLEKLEKKHGVGNVSRDELTEAVAKHSDDAGGDISRALGHGYIEAAT